MAVIASATGVALGMTAGTIGAGLVGGAVLGAGIGGLYSAVTGDGNILNSMLTGGLIGGAAGGLGAAYAAPAAAAGATGTGAAGAAATTVETATPALTAAQTTAANAALAGGDTTAGMIEANAANTAAAEAAKAAAVKTAALTGKEMLGYGLAGTAAMQLLGGKKTGVNAPTDPGMVRPYQFSSNPTAATGSYPSPYATAQYDAAGMPIMDTRERNYFDQKYTALTPYSAKTGTVNPNVPIAAANGGLMAIGGPVQQMSQNVMGGQGNMFPQSQQVHTNFATPTQMPASAEVIRSDYDTKTDPYSGVMMANGGIARFADKGAVDEEAELRKTVMNNLKKLSPDQVQNVMGATDEQQFLRKNMPNYAASMSPSISSMVEGAQYGDRMTQAYGGQPRDVNVMPRIQDANNYGGIASIGQQIDPMGLNKAGGVRHTQNFGVGGVTYDPATQTYAGTGMSQAPATPAIGLPPLAADLVASLTPQYQAANPYKYAYDPKSQKYSTATPNMGQLQAFKTEQDRIAAEQIKGYGSGSGGDSGSSNGGGDGGGSGDGGDAKGGYVNKNQVNYHPSQLANGGGITEMYSLGGYSDGGRLLRGPGDGVSDDIPATIAGKQPARLADGEFVIPARIVSEIGNGSTDAGAKRLYAMMDRIQAGRKKTIGKKNIAKDTKAKKHLLA
jgi:hypothetical protein